jgi:hypothetical protein
VGDKQCRHLEGRVTEESGRFVDVCKRCGARAVLKTDVDFFLYFQKLTQDQIRTRLKDAEERGDAKIVELLKLSLPGGIQRDLQPAQCGHANLSVRITQEGWLEEICSVCGNGIRMTNAKAVAAYISNTPPRQRAEQIRQAETRGDMRTAMRLRKSSST